MFHLSISNPPSPFLVVFLHPLNMHRFLPQFAADDNSLPYPSSDLRRKSLILVKVWCLLIVFGTTLVAGVSPYLMKWNQGFIVLGTQFAGGVFLGTALMDFLRDSNGGFEKLTSKGYPFAFMLACFGYLFTMLADRIVVHVYGKRSRSAGGAAFSVQGLVQQRKASSSSGASTSQFQVQDNGIDHYTDPSIFAANSLADSFLLILALCFHSIYEGIAIGVANTSSRAWRVLWTVTLHKVFTAIAMGIAIFQRMPDFPLLSCIPYAFAFAISTPVGVAIGIVIDATSQGLVADWIYAISMGLSCGVFIYISIHHLISRGYSPLRSTSVDTLHHKFLAVVLGVVVVAIVMIWDT